MDREHFDGIARLFASAGTRRTALGALLGTVLLGAGAAQYTEAGRRKKRRQRRKRRRQRQNRVCYGTLVCSEPKTGHDFDDCDYSNTSIFVAANAGGSSFRRTNVANAVMDGANLQGTSFQDANLAGASMRGVDVTNAVFTGACLLGTDFTGFIFSEGVIGNAFLCKTRIDSGPLIDRDCGSLPKCCRRSDEGSAG